MEIRFYTPELNMIGVMENQISLQWRRKFFEPGEFELVAPVTEYNIYLCKLGNIVYVKGAAEAGVIESITIQQDEHENDITATGRFLESYMDRRLIRPKFNYSGTVETAMRTILTNAVPIPLVELGEFHGYEERISFQATYKNLMEYETKLSKQAGIGYRFTPDMDRRKLVFDLFKGIDHSESQAERTRVTFSESYGNLQMARYEENDLLLKTVVYVGGRGEGEQREFVIVGDDTLTGLQRRELFYNGSDVDPSELTDEQYRQKLIARGEDRLKERALIKAFECEATPTGNFVYHQDYDLGDVVTVRKESWDVAFDMRITELLEIYERGAMVVMPTFGNPLPEKIDWSDTTYG